MLLDHFTLLRIKSSCLTTRLFEIGHEIIHFIDVIKVPEEMCQFMGKSTITFHTPWNWLVGVMLFSDEGSVKKW